MKRVLKIVTILLIIIGLYTIFIIEESIRINNNSQAKPLIIIGRTKYCISCIEPGETLEMEYYGLGYKVKMKYYFSIHSSEDNKMITITSKEFKLFYKYKL